tara:strand:+ start:325 stop:456 length:132 start_codon:yes stop_codon:yes gene_type:complete
MTKKDKGVTHLQELQYVWMTLKELTVIIWEDVRKGKRWHIREK